MSNTCPSDTDSSDFEVYVPHEPFWKGKLDHSCELPPERGFILTLLSAFLRLATSGTLGHCPIGHLGINTGFHKHWAS